MMRSRMKSSTLGGTKGAPALIPIAEIPSTATTTTKAVTKKFSNLDVGAKQATTAEEGEWEVRPGGMLVQKRDPDADARPPLPPIRVRVKYGAVYHEIRINREASFGELKKLLSAQIGLHPQAQKVLFKDKERDSNAFLDISGVKDRSKLVVLEDPAGQAKRFLEMRKNAKMEKAAKSISMISLEVDRLASQVSLLESIISKGKKVAEKDVIGLIEQLMNLLIKLDGIIADGDVKLQRGMQVQRVQKYVETLDLLKIKNAMPKDELHVSQKQQQQQNNTQQHKSNNQQHYQQQKQSEPQTVTTTRWETFDLLSSMPSTSSASTTTTSAASTTTSNRTTPSSHIPRFDWELF